MFELDFPRGHTGSPATGVIKQQVNDFYVEELMRPSLSAQGEHVWLWVEKQGQNTEYVAKQIARYASVRDMDVGFSGMKDRWAVTRQWFSVYLAAKPEPEWSRFKLDGVSILKTARHEKKLRRGEHFANRFKILVRDFQQFEGLEQSLTVVSAQGFPNYFGLQRFGLDAANLHRGMSYFDGKIKASRSQRSFYLSAARSYLYNLNLAGAVENGTWLEPRAAGPLYGDLQPGVEPISAAEQEIFDRYPVLVQGLHKNRLKLERRPYCIRPETFEWQCDEDQLLLSFELPTGVFATSLLDELMCVELGSGGGRS